MVCLLFTHACWCQSVVWIVSAVVEGIVNLWRFHYITLSPPLPQQHNNNNNNNNNNGDNIRTTATTAASMTLCWKLPLCCWHSCIESCSCPHPYSCLRLCFDLCLFLLMFLLLSFSLLPPTFAYCPQSCSVIPTTTELLLLPRRLPMLTFAITVFYSCCHCSL